VFNFNLLQIIALACVKKRSELSVTVSNLSRLQIFVFIDHQA
jgi:hypothetical protein